MDDARLIDTITAHEGYRQFYYADSVGLTTVAIGRCLDSKRGKGILMHEAMYLLQNDIDDCKAKLQVFPWYIILNPVRQGALIELVFNLGINGLLSFKNMIASLSKSDFKAAVKELLNSLWAKQVGPLRSSNIAYRLEYGAHQHS